MSAKRAVVTPVWRGLERLEPRQLMSASPVTYAENFSDGVADNMAVVSGQWEVLSNGWYRGKAGAGESAVSLVETSQPLYASATVEATLRALAGGASQNALIIFDYQSAADFKYAGGFAGGGKWKIGHVTGGEWFTDASADGGVTAATDYQAKLAIDGSTATLSVGGQQKVSFTFADALADGEVGFGANAAQAAFDNVNGVSNPPPPPRPPCR